MKKAPEQSGSAKDLLKETEDILDKFTTQYKITKEYITVKYADLTPYFAVEATALSNEDKAALFASMKSVGIIQPIVVADGKEILEGCHRAGFAKELGWDTGDAINLTNVPEGIKAVIAYHLNFSRRNANADIKHTAYLGFETRIMKLLEDKTYAEGVKLLPDIDRFFEGNKKSDNPLSQVEIRHTVACFAGISPSTTRSWKADEKTRDQMALEQPDIYPIASEISKHDVQRFRQRKKQLKKSKGSMLYMVCGTLCKACDRKDSCLLLSAIYNRKCTVQANHDTIAKWVDAPFTKEDEKHYSNPKMVLAEYYRRRKAIALSDKAWKDSTMPRVLVESGKLYEACGCNLDIARFCIERTAQKFEVDKLSWALATVMKSLGDCERQWNEEHPNQKVSLGISK
jgi:hypothetical protein